MRDTTQWRKDADRLRQRLLAAYRDGSVDSIASATQALEALLQRPDRPAASMCKTTTANRRVSTTELWQSNAADLTASDG